MFTDKKSCLSHLLLPGFLLGTLLIITHLVQLDYRLADALYSWGRQQWVLRHNWWLEIVIHEHGKNLVRSLPILLLALYGGSYWYPPLQRYRRGLLYLIVVPLCTVSLIALLKDFSGTVCPSQLQRYGGAFTTQESWFFPRIGQRGCTPAGHSSGAYAWVALYFFARVYFPARRFYALLPGMALGLTYGIAQQLRGDHFLSHDLWTLAICWYGSLAGAWCFFGRSKDPGILRQ